MKNPYGKVVFLTGASSGIGQACAKTLAEEGFYVYGGSRRGGENTLFESGGFITMLKVDVTSTPSVEEAVKQILAEQGRIDILINCAGIGISGAVEDCTGEDGLEQMNTNYAGILRTVRAVLPQMRERRNGLIINIGSVGGIFSIPFQTLYSSSKYAVEALTEGLRIELKPFSVRASLIEPGDVKTGFTAARRFTQASKTTAYGDEFRHAIAQMEHDEQNGADPSLIVRSILKTIRSKNPPVRRVPGLMYKVFVFLKRILPARTVEWILTLMYPKSSK
ncbi:MAG: SDR family oxidoreductase [Clostridia bacterium]|nr:SDR family oxidoreductase [Clostridia bacterium]